MHFLLIFAVMVGSGVSRPSSPGDTLPAVSLSATIVGVVTDSVGSALVGADILIDGIRLAPTGAFGSFVVKVTANRRHVIQVRSLGYLPGQFSLILAPGETRTAEITLTSVATLLPGVRVTVHQEKPDSYDPGLAGFEHRRQTLGGTFLNTTELKERGYPPLSMLLRTVPGVTVTRHSVSMRGSGCAVVYIDGHPSHGDGDIDDYINTHELAAVEVYPSSAWVPIQFMGPNVACGTIVLWTADGLLH